MYLPPLLLNKAVSALTLRSTKTPTDEHTLQVSMKKLEADVLIHAVRQRTLLGNPFIYYRALLKTLESTQTLLHSLINLRSICRHRMHLSFKNCYQILPTSIFRIIESLLFNFQFDLQVDMRTDTTKVYEKPASICGSHFQHERYDI